ncbi:hypothetical protein AVEN_76156-1 [Araneus ventricosus]|uniref:Uncharacterized protein n=1 Tax=Araneus ventricosus TaxID=182803 RepID=A0A4Y2E6R7_ARAVE|nr:hypothetical protein AVEN_76156-1 [Araneus ventricosus]
MCKFITLKAPRRANTSRLEVTTKIPAAMEVEFIHGLCHIIKKPKGSVLYINTMQMLHQAVHSCPTASGRTEPPVHEVEPLDY